MSADPDPDAIGDAIAAAVIDAIDNAHADRHFESGANAYTDPKCDYCSDAIAESR